MELRLHRISLPLRRVFRTAHGATGVKENLLVELRDGDVSGYGEAAPAPYYGATAAAVAAALEAARPQIEAARWNEPATLWHALLPVLGHDRCALGAVDQAAHDLWGKRLGRPTYRLWGLTLDRCPSSNVTIGIDSIEAMAAALDEFAGWPIYKIKLGTPQDLEIVRALRRRTEAAFRVDANCGWTAAETIANSRALADLGVEFIEQPLPPGDTEGMRRVFAESALPVVADESCVVEEDVDRCRGSFHGINIKLDKCGGMTPARRMIARARSLGLKVMVGCMTESSVGISAIGQLLPLVDYVDMDGAMLLARDVAAGVRLDHGRAVFPEENGNGVRLLE